MDLRRFVWVQSHWTAKKENIEQETQRSEEGKILAEENEHFPPLTSAFPRLLFDFLPALMSPKDGEKTHADRRRAKKVSHVLTNHGVFQRLFSIFASGSEAQPTCPGTAKHVRVPSK